MLFESMCKSAQCIWPSTTGAVSLVSWTELSIKIQANTAPTSAGSAPPPRLQHTTGIGRVAFSVANQVGLRDFVGVVSQISELRRFAVCDPHPAPELLVFLEALFENRRKRSVGSDSLALRQVASQCFLAVLLGGAPSRDFLSQSIRAELSHDSSASLTPSTASSSQHSLFGILVDVELGRFLVLDKFSAVNIAPETDDAPWLNILPQSFLCELRCCGQILHRLKRSARPHNSDPKAGSSLYPHAVRTGTTGNSLFDCIQLSMVRVGLVPTGWCLDYYLAFLMLTSLSPEVGLQVAVIEVATHSNQPASVHSTLIPFVLVRAVTSALPMLFSCLNDLAASRGAVLSATPATPDMGAVLVQSLERRLREELGSLAIDKFIYDYSFR